MKLKCLIVDDEHLALDVLEEFIKRIDVLELAGSCSNAPEAFSYLQKGNIDLMFLDIEMPKMRGTEFVRSLKSPPKVIFTTAYSNYAVEGFELEAVDYLLKPISFERFLKAVNKAINEMGRPEISIQTESDTYNDAFIYLKSEKKMTKVFLKDILFVESQRNYSKIKTADREILSNIPISQIEEKLPESKFLRTHRSFIVALDKILAFSQTQIELKGFSVPIGRNYKDEVNRVLNPGEQV